jgi:hypothetical protein
MEQTERRLRNDFIVFINFLLRNLEELEILYLQEQYRVQDPPILRFLHRHEKDSGSLFNALQASHPMTLTSPKTYESRLDSVVETTLRELRNVHKNLKFKRVQELEKLAELGNVNKKLEILVLLKPGEKTDRRSIRDMTYRRRITRALNRLSALDFITWDKREEIALTIVGAELRKTLLEVSDLFEEVMAG